MTILAVAVTPVGPTKLFPTIASRVLGALSVVHSGGMLHRDIKPGNILLADSGAAKIADFGIAKAAGESTSLTSTGITVGTVSYISPEAIEGCDLDHRADIYSLGCTACQLLSGTTPFTANSIAALMSAHLTRPAPAITDHAPHLPSALIPVFAQVLAKDPDDRYQSCADFVADL